MCWSRHSRKATGTTSSFILSRAASRSSTAPTGTAGRRAGRALDVGRRRWHAARYPRAAAGGVEFDDEPGAGEVGYHVARSLRDEGHDVCVVETNSDRLERLADLDVTSVKGNIANTSILEGEAKAKHESEVKEIVTRLKDQTRALAKQACFDCHSNETEWPAYSYVAPMSWLVRNDVEQGSSLSNALAKHPKAFSGLYVNMVAAGEVRWPQAHRDRARAPPSRSSGNR